MQHFKNIETKEYCNSYLGVVVAMALNMAAKVSKVVMPIVTRPGTWSKGIKRLNQPIMTNRPEGR